MPTLSLALAFCVHGCAVVEGRGKSVPRLSIRPRLIGISGNHKTAAGADLWPDGAILGCPMNMSRESEDVCCRSCVMRLAPKSDGPCSVTCRPDRRWVWSLRQTRNVTASTHHLAPRPQSPAPSTTRGEANQLMFCFCCSSSPDNSP
jgi:hypothetical protein